jgi:hypothetical protein
MESRTKERAIPLSQCVASDFGSEEKGGVEGKSHVREKEVLPP